MSNVGQCSMCTSPLSTRFLTKEYRISMCRVRFVHDRRSFFSNCIELILSWCSRLSATFCPCACRKYNVQMICGITSCTPINSLSVKLRATRFCPVATLYMEPLPISPTCMALHVWVNYVGGIHPPSNDTAAIRFQLQLQILNRL